MTHRRSNFKLAATVLLKVRITGCSNEDSGSYRLNSSVLGRAEKSLRTLLRTRYFDQDEEFITQLFHGELRAVVEKASNEGIVRKSFLKDLEGAFPNLKYSQDLSRIAEGIRATTVLHPRELEKKQEVILVSFLFGPMYIPATLTIQS